MDRPAVARSTPERRRPTQKRGTIVVVDDSDICRRAASLMLERAGYTIIVLDNPIGFGAVLRDRRPDLALVDVNMPTLRGDHLVSLAKKHAGDDACPIVLFSDLPAAELDVLARRCGAAGFVRKGGDWNGIVRAVEGFIPAR